MTSSTLAIKFLLPLMGGYGSYITDGEFIEPQYYTPMPIQTTKSISECMGRTEDQTYKLDYLEKSFNQELFEQITLLANDLVNKNIRIPLIISDCFNELLWETE